MDGHHQAPPLIFTELSPMDPNGFSLSSPQISSLLSTFPLTPGTSLTNTMAPTTLAMQFSVGGSSILPDSSTSGFSAFSPPSSSMPQSMPSSSSDDISPPPLPSSQSSANTTTTSSASSSSMAARTKRVSQAESTGRLCRICSDKSDGAHFGVDSCRACAAFFRRSIVMKKKYVCRQGGHNCNINKSVRCMCRKCRFVKCLQCGMLPESVQQKASSTDMQDSPEAPSASGSGFASTSAFGLPNVSSSSYGGDLSMSSTPNGQVENDVVRQIPSNPAVAYPNGVTKLLQIDQNYKLFCSLRRSTEMSMSNTDLRGIFNTSPANEMRPTTFSNLNKLVKSSIPMMADFCTQSFPQFNELEHEEKWSVFQNFIASMWNVETIYRTHKIFPNDLTKKVASYTTYIDLDDLETFFSDTTTSMDVKHFSNLVKKNIMDTVRRIVRMLSKIDVSEIEYAALLGLLMWPPYLPNASERVIEMALSIRELLFRELHVYYSTIQRMEDYAGRLGELMSLYSSLQWSTNRMKEDMEIFKLFDIFSEDSFIYDIIKTPTDFPSRP